MSDKKKGDIKTLRRVLLMLPEYRGKIAVSLVLSAVTVSAAIILPRLFGGAIDLITGAGNTNLGDIRSKLFVSAALIVLCAAAMFLLNRINSKIVLGVSRSLRDDIYEKLNRLPVSFADTHPAGDTVSRLTNDTERLSDGLLLGFQQLFSGILTIAGTLVMMFAVSPATGLAVALLTPLSLFAAKFIAGRTHRYFVEKASCLGEETAFVNETLTGVKIIRTFGAENTMRLRFGDINARLADTSLKATFFSSLTNPVTRFVNSLVYAAVALIGAYSILSGGAFTVGILTAMLSYANQYTKPFNEISGVITELQASLASAERILSLLDAEEEKDNGDITAFNSEGGIALKNISFGYEKGKTVLHGISLTAEKGQKIAIVGKTGCGKTTLINLLMRFYEPDAGEILLDGTDISKIDRRTLRKNFGMVLQDNYIMAGTIRENITPGNGFTDDDIIAAAKLTHAWSFIKRLPSGLDTPVNEAGEGLSAGQKQLLCITRVMLADPRILLLDEATSSIDTATERRVQKAFDRLTEGRTSIIVAHRLSTVKNADMIIVMDDGRIAEDGTHSDLMQKDGIYAGMIKASCTNT